MTTVKDFLESWCVANIPTVYPSDSGVALLTEKLIDDAEKHDFTEKMLAQETSNEASTVKEWISARCVKATDEEVNRLVAKDKL